MKSTDIAVATLCVAVVVSVPANGQTTIVLYDNFASSSVNPSKWIGVDCDPASLRDTVRRVVRGESDSSSGLLHFFDKAYALTNTDFGGTGCPFGLEFP